MQRQPGERPETGGPITVQYFKYSGDLHWRHDMVLLGGDDHGTWLGGPAGTIIQRGQEPPRQWPSPFVQLISRGQWWSLHYNGSYSDRFRMYIDVAMPADWVSSVRVEMVDLDLDVVMGHDGVVALLDEDEFLVHAQEFSYPDWLVDRARMAAAELMLLVEAGEEPFGTAGEKWLRMVDGNPSGS